MNIQFNTDSKIDGNEKLEAYINSSMVKALNRFKEHITRVEVHLSEEHAGKSGKEDIKCTIEARLENRTPIAVTDIDQSIEKAFSGATKKLKNALDTIYGKMKDH